MHLTAAISHISRGSLHDGPGVRTVVYFKGCGLRCRWCHNPETLSLKQEILYAPMKCIHCGSCIARCPDCHKAQGNEMVFLREQCQGCGRCAEGCPTGALSLCGERMEVTDVMGQILKDQHYYRQSGGGVTLSGGECLLQADFCAALMTACRELGISAMVETALAVPWEQVEKVLPLCSGVLADFKIPDPEKHRVYTGQDNVRILQNLEKLTLAAPGMVTVRIPLIPGVNDTMEDIAGFGNCLAHCAHALRGIEVLRYNSLAESKYLLSGRVYTDFGQPQTESQLHKYCEDLSESLQGKTTVYTVV